MALAPYDQAMTTIREAKHVLICFPEQVSGDGVATSLGLARTIAQLTGRHADVVSTGFRDAHRDRYRFLPGIDRVRASIAQLHDLTIRVPLRGAVVRDIQHDVRGDHLEIRLSPDTGELSHEHVESALSAYRYDCIITVDCPDLPALGALYAQHATFFQSTPTIAIDHSPANERYAHVNLIDVTAAACGEVATAFLRAAAPYHLDADTATCLLTGILTKTRSFRTPTMTPKTFEVAAALLAASARREEILAHLQQTKTVAQLTLWGRALTRLRHDADRGILWTLLSQHDFLAAGAAESDLLEIVDELLIHSPDARHIVLCYEQRDGTICVLTRASHPSDDATGLLASLGATGNRDNARLCLPTNNLLDAERKVIGLLQSQIATH